jgi:hypothetical protein
MKYCPFCHRWNLDRPQLCNYCGRSWYVRLCPRGHENPYDAQFCGLCGSADLTDTSGPRPFWLRLLRAGFLLILILFIVSVVHELARVPELLASLAPFIMAIAILLIGYYAALTFLPSPLRIPFSTLNKLVMNGAIRLLQWFWEKVKLALS